MPPLSYILDMTKQFMKKGDHNMIQETYKITQKLFESNMILHKWSGVKIGMESTAPQAVSTANTSRRRAAKASIVAIGLEKLLDCKISVSHVPGQPAVYVEYEKNNGDIYPFFVQRSASSCTYKVSQFTATPQMQMPAREAVIAIFAACVYSPYMHTNQSWYDELFSAYKKLISNPDNEFLMFYICDLFYYAYAKKYSNMELTIDDSACKAELDRLIQTNAMIHDPETPEPKLIRIDSKSNTNETSKKKAKEANKQPIMFTEPILDFYERCKRGEFKIDYNWNTTQEKYIVPLSFLDTFVPTESFRLILLSTWYQIQNILKRIEKGLSYNEIMGKNPINIKIMGKPGTGKTTVIEAVLASLGYPKGLITCKDRMEEDDIEGQSKFVNGTVWNIPTKAGELHSIGGAIVLEEFNLPDPGILQGSLGQALAYPFILKVDGYKEYTRHPLTIYFATMNIGTSGSKPMNEALSSRFPEGFILEDVPDDEFINILASAGYKKTNCKKVYKTYKSILNYLRQYHEELVLSITLRHCLNALDKISIGFTEKQAYENTFLSQLYSSDPDVAADIRSFIGLI